MRILFVGIASGIHAARWVKQFEGLGWDLHFFNSAPHFGTAMHPVCPPVKCHGIFEAGRARRIGRRIAKTRFIRPFYNRLYSSHQVLARTIERVQPDVVHSLSIQNSAYLTLDAMHRVRGPRPPWIVTNYGSDLFLFGRMHEHSEQVKRVLRECNYYTCETLRDVKLCRDFDFDGEILGPVLPNAGGYPLSEIEPMRTVPPSQRRMIAIKGYQQFYGRAFVALRAIERCADVLQDYQVRVYSPNTSDVADVARLINGRTGIRIQTIPLTDDHQKILRLHGGARMSISLSLSDGVCTSFLEAMMMGSFPIQSCTASAHDWIEDGRTGAIVHPDDPESVEAAIRLAVSSDELVDQAAQENWETAKRRLDHGVIKEHAIRWYEYVANGGRAEPGSKIVVATPSNDSKLRLLDVGSSKIGAPAAPNRINGHFSSNRSTKAELNGSIVIGPTAVKSHVKV